MFTLFRHGRDRFSFLPRTYCSGPSFARATPWQVLAPPRAVPKKVAARLRNPGEPRTLRPSLCLGRRSRRKERELSFQTKERYQPL
jgi:hypothetical protein